MQNDKNMIPPSQLAKKQVQDAFKEITNTFLGRPSSWGPRNIQQRYMKLMLTSKTELKIFIGNIHN